MSSRSRSIVVLVLLLALQTFALNVKAINKCEDEDGNITFQDLDCGRGESAEKVKIRRAAIQRSVPEIVKPDNVNPHYLPLPGIGQLILLSFDWWDYQVVDNPDDELPGVVMRAKAGEEPLSLQLSFIRNPSGTLASKEDNVRVVRQMASAFVEDSVEQVIDIKRIPTSLGIAYLANFTDRKYESLPAPEGEYRSITIGQLIHPRVAVGITILSGGADSKEHDEALDVVTSFTLVPD